MKPYSVARLARLAGVSVRTLHLYDRIGLLKPANRTDAGYRFYGEPELLRLQQILFYKELGLSLQGIADILDDPCFDLLQALEGHRKALKAKMLQLQTMLTTLDKTMFNLKENNMLQHEELYEGLSKEEAGAYRKEAIEKYGEHAVARSESALRNRSKAELEQLKAEQKTIYVRLYALQGENPEGERVQTVIRQHYRLIRKFWGTDGDPDPQAAAYAGLADLYLTDKRFLQTDGKAQPELAAFLKKAMTYFATHMPGF